MKVTNDMNIIDIQSKINAISKEQEFKDKISHSIK